MRIFWTINDGCVKTKALWYEWIPFCKELQFCPCFLSSTKGHHGKALSERTIHIAIMWTLIFEWWLEVKKTNKNGERGRSFKVKCYGHTLYMPQHGNASTVFWIQGWPSLWEDGLVPFKPQDHRRVYKNICTTRVVYNLLVLTLTSAALLGYWDLSLDPIWRY